MIVDAIVGLVVGLMRGLLWLIPDWQPPTPAPGDMSFAEGVGTTVGMLSGYFPIVALGISLMVILGYRVILSGWTALVFVYDKLPFKAT